MDHSNRYWLYRLVDELGLIETDDMPINLALEPLASKVLDIANDERQKNNRVQSPFGNAIVAGSTMDLSGLLTCIDYECRRKQVDRFFAKTAHYFDSVVVEGKSAEYFVRGIEDSKSKGERFEVFHELSDDIRMLMHLRSTGLDRLLVFRDKPYRYCTTHARQHAVDLGWGDLFDTSISNDLVEQVLKSADITILDVGDA